jgi:hypothetical protein
MTCANVYRTWWNFSWCLDTELRTGGGEVEGWEFCWPSGLFAVVVNTMLTDSFTASEL